MKNPNNRNTNTEALLERNGISICYKTFGISTNPCIILIMGLGGQWIDWPTPILQGLANNGFYVIVFDNRDAGLSHYYDNLQTPELLEALIAKEQARTIEPPYTLDAMAADVIMLMDGLEIKKAHIVGISMGGMIGQILALQYPGRILSLTCIASTSGDPHLPPAKSEVLALFFTGRGSAENMESVVNHRMQIHKVYNHPDDVNEHKAREHFIISYQRANNPEGFTRQLLAIIFAEPRFERLKQLKLPTLIIHGDYDPAFSLEHGKQLAKLIPQARLEIIKKMGHGLPVSAYRKLVELIVNHCKS